MQIGRKKTILREKQEPGRLDGRDDECTVFQFKWRVSINDGLIVFIFWR
jgi:hypothetical protein